MSEVGAARRLDFIDATRGIAALMVLLQHGLEYSGFTDPFQGFGRYWVNFGQAGVATFFLVSGFVIPLGLERWKSVGHFWIGRVARIHPLYVFLLALNLVLFNRANFWSAGVVADLKVIVVHLFFLQDYLHYPGCVGAAWTLSVEMVWYAMFSAAYFMGWNRRPIAVILPLACAVIGLAVYSILSSARFPLGRFDLLLLCAQGLLFYRLFMDQMGRREFVFYTVIVMMVVMVGQGVSFGWFDHPELTIWAVANSWILGISIFVMAYKYRRSEFIRHPLLIKSGVYSYSIYLIHPFLIGVLEAFDIYGWLGFVLLVVSTLLISTLTYKYIERPAVEAAANYRRRTTALVANSR